MIKKSLQDSDEDDYYALEKKRIAEEAQKARRIHEEDVQLHLVANIPYYDEAPEDVRVCLLQLNNLLLQRFDKPGMIYWDLFRKVPAEIRDYAPDFGEDLTADAQNRLVSFLEFKKREEENLVDMGFDEDGEEDDVIIETEKDEKDELETAETE